MHIYKISRRTIFKITEAHNILVTRTLPSDTLKHPRIPPILFITNSVFYL